MTCDCTPHPPQGAVNVPFMLKSTGAASSTDGSGSGADKSLGMKTGGLKMEENGRFLEEVLELFPPGTRLIVGSANKDRSAAALFQADPLTTCTHDCTHCLLPRGLSA